MSEEKYSELALMLYNFLLLNMLLYLYYEGLRFRGVIDFGNIGWIMPIIFYVLVIAWLLLPLPALFWHGRCWILNVILRICIAPFAEVTFADFWVADQLTSLGEFLFEAQFIFCIYPISLSRPGTEIY